MAIDLDKLYDKVKILESQLVTSNCDELAGIIHHRMYIVAWTCGSELVEELITVLTSDLANEAIRMHPILKHDFQRILSDARSHLGI